MPRNDNENNDLGTLDNDCQVKTNVVWHRLPLDMFCYNSCEEQPLTREFVRLLTNGIPPLHVACSLPPRTSWLPYRKVTLEELAALSAPEDWKRFHQGMLPLHCACRSQVPDTILLWLCEKYPDAVRICTTDTMDSPLHCYLSSTNHVLHTTTTNTTTTMHDDDSMAHESLSPLPLYSFSAVEYLVKQYPAAVHMTNQLGYLPFHLAVMHDAPIDILLYLARRNPESLLLGHD